LSLKTTGAEYGVCKTIDQSSACGAEYGICGGDCICPDDFTCLKLTFTGVPGYDLYASKNYCVKNPDFCGSDT